LHTPLRRPALLAALALSLGAAGCFSSTAPAAFCTGDTSCAEGTYCDRAAKKCVPGVLVTVSPATATIGPGASTSLSAAVAGSANPAVQWSVTEGATAGTLTPSGGIGVVFVSAGRAGTYHVVAASVASPAATATATITVNPLQLSPTSASVNVGKTQQFTANGPGTWSVQEAAGGTISTTGLYTAPSTAGTYHVAVANPATSTTATVTVLPPVSLTLTPGSPTVAAKGSVQFTANLSNAPPNNAGVVWTVQEPTGGSVSGTGLYTAPNAGGTFHVQVVANADPLAAAVVAVTVTPPPSVKVTPSPVAMQQGKSQQFSAAVTSPPNGNTAVTWSVQEAGGGSVSAAGVYVAPILAGTFHVVATLVADTTVSGSATIVVAAGPPDAGKSTFTAVASAGGAVHADGQESFLVTAVLKDPGGGLLPGAAIAFAPQAGLVFTPSAGSPAAAWQQGALTTSGASAFAGTSDGAATFSVYVTSSTAQTVTLTGSTCFSLPCTPGGSGDLKVSLVFAPTPWLPASAGIEGVTARGIAIDPKDSARLYLATTNGVFVSTNKGASWTKPGPGLDGVEVGPVQVGPGASPLLYATGITHRTSAAQRIALHVSADGGLTWTSRLMSQELQNQPTVAADPTTPGTVYVGALALYRTTDSGLTWTKVIAAPSNGSYRQIKALSFDPAKPGSVLVLGVDYAATQTPFLYGASDGVTFTKLNAVVQGSANFPGDFNASGLARDPNGRVVLVAADGRTFSSTDGGVTWTQQGQAPGPNLVLLGPDNALYAACACGAVSKSIDGAASWTPVVNQGPNGLNGIALDPSDTTRVYLSAFPYSPGAGAGFSIAVNGTAAPSLTGLGPPAPLQSMVAIDPSSSAKVVQIVDGVLYRSANGGVTWTRSSLALPGSGDVTSLAIDQSGLDDTVKYGGLWILRGSLPYRLAGGATAWSTITVPAASGGFYAVRSDPVTSGTDYLLPYDGTALYVTQDGGSTWTSRPLPPAVAGNTNNAYGLRAVNHGGTAAPKTTLYLNYRAGDQTGKFMRSTDGGANWIPLRTETAASPSYGGYYPDATDPQTFFFDVQGTLTVTRNAFTSQSAVQVLGNPTNAFAFATDPRTSGTAWAGTYTSTGPTFVLTTDSGATWQRADSGLGQPTNSTTEFFFGSGLMLLSNGFHGLFRTTSNGL
jgi:hypothetical protein